MAISANSIMHYTGKLDNILNILKNRKLRYSYCSEKIVTRGNKNFKAAIAMISFCDIPLSDYKKHFYNKKDTEDLGYYGDYGIGLSKRWAKDNGLNPVFYVESRALVGSSLRWEFEKFTRKGVEIEVPPNHQVLYSKNYEGDLKREGKTVKKSYRFYDEREWRIVPSTLQINNYPPVLDDDAYQREKNAFKNVLATSGLAFELKDIAYIIVKEEAEIFQVYDVLVLAFEQSIESLTPIRVLTSDQIISDF
jgi:hypothetical protein